jgi:hypothetical protein
MCDHNKKLEAALTDLEALIEESIQIGKLMIETHALYSYDLFCSAILNRTVNIIRGYITLIRDKNFIAAAPLVRVHLDSLLRLYASTIIDYNVDDFSQKILSGESIRKMNDSQGNKMTDYYLSKELSRFKGFEWVRKLYEVGSGHIHFSNNIEFATTRIKPGTTRVIESVISKCDDFISLDEKEAATRRMIQVTNRTLSIISLWIKQKETYQIKKKHDTK